jgi:hypothetical protein
MSVVGLSKSCIKGIDFCNGIIKNNYQFVSKIKFIVLVVWTNQIVSS